MALSNAQRQARHRAKRSPLTNDQVEQLVESAYRIGRADGGSKVPLPAALERLQRDASEFPAGGGDTEQSAWLKARWRQVDPLAPRPQVEALRESLAMLEALGGPDSPFRQGLRAQIANLENLGKPPRPNPCD